MTPRLRELLDGAAPTTQREARILFSHLRAKWVAWMEGQAGVEIADGEGYVALTDAADGDYDGPHKKGGAHYLGTGCDMLVYLGGVYISVGAHPVWKAAGAHWKLYHPSCRWGGDWGDDNHLGIAWAGRA